ncbi:10804_t:CDS:2 [Ambispora leptoticha]|uniref:10804_t:CDS:1 n=1 Tax=Ambispora leptoticha TaxID=144679 RepID=A0A9N8W245_9GLOM|nr:10804_t:CDS:2 [Ambispora leptoticha]
MADSDNPKTPRTRLQRRLSTGFRRPVPNSGKKRKTVNPTAEQVERALSNTSFRPSPPIVITAQESSVIINEEPENVSVILDKLSSPIIESTTEEHSQKGLRPSAATISTQETPRALRRFSNVIEHQTPQYSLRQSTPSNKRTTITKPRTPGSKNKTPQRSNADTPSRLLATISKKPQSKIPETKSGLSKKGMPTPHGFLKQLTREQLNSPSLIISTSNQIDEEMNRFWRVSDCSSTGQLNELFNKVREQSSSDSENDENQSEHDNPDAQNSEINAYADNIENNDVENEDPSNLESSGDDENDESLSNLDNFDAQNSGMNDFADSIENDNAEDNDPLNLVSSSDNENDESLSNHDNSDAQNSDNIENNNVKDEDPLDLESSSDSENNENLSEHDDSDVDNVEDDDSPGLESSSDNENDENLSKLDNSGAQNRELNDFADNYETNNVEDGYPSDLEVNNRNKPLPKSKSSKSSKKNKRFSAAGIPVPNLPKVLVKQIFTMFAKTKVSNDAMEAVFEGTHRFFEQAAMSLSNISEDDGRDMIIETENLLPRELSDKICQSAVTGNAVYPPTSITGRNSKRRAFSRKKQKSKNMSDDDDDDSE